jgi:hypothetical protein
MSKKPEPVRLDSAHGYNGPTINKPSKDEPKVVVRFLRPFPPWQTNEIAGFPESRAMILVKPLSKKIGGTIAELYVPPKEMEE